jgi:uncharacterized membrane protein (UPF0127 family)
MRLMSTVLSVLLVCCGCGRNADNGLEEQLNTRIVTLPDGAEIRVEVLIKPAEMARGMMYRDPLPPGRGLLFVHQKPDYYRYWMSNVKAPLDIIFMDASRQIVEISADTPPCATKPEDCLLYGGHKVEQYVLELRAGEARRLGLHAGQKLSF